MIVRPAPDSLIVSALLTCMVGLGALSTDMYLPMLPAIGREFSAPVASVQLTLSVFMYGFAISQLAYGPLSDRFGRRPVLLAGLALYLIGSIACVLASSIGTLIAFRFLQAIGACAGPILARAVVRDVYARERSATVLAYMASAMALIPAIAPIFGGWIGVWFGWRIIFVVMALFTALLLACLAMTLRETNAHVRADALKLDVLLLTYLSFFRHRAYMGYMLANALIFGGMFAFISGSSFVLIDVVGVAPENFGFCFAGVVAGYIIGSQTAGRMTPRFGIDRVVFASACCGALSGSLLLVPNLVFGASVLTIVPAMALFFGSGGALMPNAVAGAIAPFPAQAGSASALLGFVQMAAAASGGALVGHLHDGTSLPMTSIVFVMGALAWVCFLLLRTRP
jgi:DHA1 family bicyclomycin/chloramphenicol resistance-like MFS transporter